SANGALKMPAQPQAASLRGMAWGAVSVPRKNLGEPEVAALRRASRCFSRLATGRQYMWGRRPPAKMALRLMRRWCGVTVAGMLGQLAVTKSAASAVVM